MKFISFNDPLMTEPVNTQELPTNMDLECMHQLMSNKNLLLITANQVGIQCRMFIQKLDGSNVEMFNPTFTPTSDSRICVVEKSPQLNTEFAVNRYREITATWSNRNGAQVTQYLTGMSAATFQSGIDYLNGMPPWAYSKRKVID